MEIELGLEEARWVNENVLVQWVHDEPSFAYTIGMWQHNMPELIVVGQGFQHSGMTLNLLIARMHKYGSFKAGDIDIDLFTAPTKFGTVAQSEVEERMTRTIEAAYPLGRPPLRDIVIPEIGVLQVLWPDRAGIFPDEPGYSREFARQKVLA